MMLLRLAKEMGVYYLHCPRILNYLFFIQMVHISVPFTSL